MLRRAFVAIGLGFLFGSNAIARKLPEAKILVLDQSGIFGEVDFIFGSWLISDEFSTRDDIGNLRKLTKYKRCLSYRSTDRLKNEFAKSIINNFIKHKINTVRLVTFRPNAQFPLRIDTERYINFLTKEIEAAVSEVDIFKIICQRRFSGDLDKAIKEKLIARIPGLKDITYKKEREEPLIQCLGLLTGCAYKFLFERTNVSEFDKNWRPNKTKQRLKMLLEKWVGLNFPWKTKKYNLLLITTRQEN